MSGQCTFSKLELLRVYDEHPLRVDTILSRIRKSNPLLENITEADLSTDGQTEITDQNHIGGIEFLRELAEIVALTPDTRVLDVGSGLGGAGRVLAGLYGCRVDGVEVSPSRHAAAEELTNLVRLGHLVRYVLADFRDAELRQGYYDVVLGLDTFAHFADKSAALGRCRWLLKPHGVLAVTECYLSTPQAKPTAARQIRELAQYWLAHLVDLDGWLRLHDAAGFVVSSQDDLTDRFIEYLNKLVEVSPEPPEREICAWRLARELAERGVIRYARTIGRRID